MLTHSAASSPVQGTDTGGLKRKLALLWTRQLPTSSGSAKRRKHGPQPPASDPDPARTYNTEPLMRRYRLEPPRHDPR
jgi:hypothetical protein